MNLAVLAVGRLIAVGALPRGHVGRIISTILAALLLASFAQTPTVDELLARSAEQRDRGELVESLQSMREAYQLAPAPELLNNIGYLLQLIGEYGEAYEVYERVIADPSADEELVRLDRQRLAELGPKLDSCWVVVDLELAPDLLIDGARVDPKIQEIQLRPGQHALELHSGDTMVRWIRFPIAKRATIDRATFEAEEWATISIDIPLDSLIIDRYLIANHRVARVRVPVNEYQIAARLPGRGEVRLTRSLDRDLSLGALFAPLVLPPEPSPALPWVTIGFGAAGVITGSVLLALAEVDRSTVENAMRDERGLITELTFHDAMGLESRAYERSLGGGIAFTLGVGVVTAGILWLLFE